MTKKIKTIEEAVADVVAGPVNKQNLKITLNSDALWEARNMRELRKIETPEDFEGPDFKDIMGYQISGEWVAVSLKDGTTYVYPKGSIARVKHYNTQE